MLILSEIIVISHHTDSLSDIFRCHSNFVYLVQSVGQFVKTLELKNSVSFLQALTEDIPWEMIASYFTKIASFISCTNYICMAKLFLKNSDVHRLVKQQSKQKIWWHSLHVSRLHDLLLFVSSSKSGKILIMPAHSRLHSSWVPLPFELNPFIFLTITFWSDKIWTTTQIRQRSLTEASLPFFMLFSASLSKILLVVRPWVPTASSNSLKWCSYLY